MFDSNGLRPKLTPEERRLVMQAIKLSHEGCSKPMVLEGSLEDIKPYQAGKESSDV